jgi:hypothetical protein
VRTEAGFALRAASWLGLPGGSRDNIDRAEAYLARAQRERRKILAQVLDIAESPLSHAEFIQAVEALAQRTGQVMAPFDRQVADLLDEISWPSAIAESLSPSRRLIPRWFAGTIVVAMAAGCGVTPLGFRSPPLADAAPSAISDAAIPGNSADVRRGADGRAGTSPDLVVPPDLPRADASPLADAVCDIAAAEAEVASLITDAIGAECSVADASGPNLVPPNYAVGINGDGRIVELLTMPDGRPALTGSALQAWLAATSSDRWPCLAGHIVPFFCMALTLY